MAEFNLRDRCYINTNKDKDSFVGIACEKGIFNVHFPLGFHVSLEDRELRKDIMLLISTIGSTIGHRESGIPEEGKSNNRTGFPIQAYLTVIRDYYERGYYREREVEYNVSKKGKINWSKTIRTQRPAIQEEEAYYLDFVTRRNTVNESELITLVHEYCVYESFERMGWLFTSALPRRPRIKRQEKLFASVLKEKLSRTFNDRNKILFREMLRIVEYLQDEDVSLDFKYGTYRFEYVWEAMIDRVYGIGNKSRFFPKTTWKIGDKKSNNASLEPDSIMVYEEDIYVLDAKYYKYGATKYLGDLPESASINKQITYGEYVANNFTNYNRVYNAFIMPFDAKDELWNTDEIISIGEATGNWRNNTEIYEHVQGILVDMRYLMQITAREDLNEIRRLAGCIESAMEGE